MLRIVLASYGTRGDVEPTAALGRELLRRGHDVCMAAPPDLVAFVESAGLPAVALGPDSRQVLALIQIPQTLRHPLRPLREGLNHVIGVWGQIGATLKSLATGADVLVTNHYYQEAAANVAEYYGIPLVAWHHAPVRANGQAIAIVPSSLVRFAMTVTDWLHWRYTKAVEDTQRADLGLPKATVGASQRMAKRGSLEVQAYDELWFPKLATEWDERRPFVGAMTLDLPTDADEEVVAWIGAGTPPIYFGFGSMLIHTFADMVNMISAACARLGERALICCGASDLAGIGTADHVKVVCAVRHATTFPACRAVVHHGGAGTTAAALRAGVPTLILSVAFDQPIWARCVKQLKVGWARPFSATTMESLVGDLRRILAPDYVRRAREVATRMTESAVSVSTAADLVEGVAGRPRG